MCGQCAKNCAAKAIEFDTRNHPVFIRKKCISCFCCAELCSENAIKPKTKGFTGFFS